MSLHPNRRLLLLLLIAATSSCTLGVEGNTQSGNSQAAQDNVSKDSSASSSLLLTAPAELVPVSSENLRFSRLLKDTANVLQFSSISNAAPPIWGIQDSKKEAKAKSNSIAASNFGRRALDYDETRSVDEPTSETKIVAHPYPGNEYVYVRPGKLEQHIEGQDSEVAASVTSINNKPPRVPLALLRQKKGKRVNISPLFTELPQLEETAAKEFVWVDQPTETVVGVNRQGRKQQEVDDDSTTNPAFQEEDLYEATTLPEEVPVETTTPKEQSKMVVNIVTSAPRQSVSVEASSGGKKIKNPRLRTKSTTSTAPPPTTTTEAATTTTTSASTTTSEVPTTTTVGSPVFSSPKSAAAVADDKENLVADASQRAASSLHGFADSQAKLQTAESSQPARVNVRPAQNGKEYEYEYIYYYYDDDDENSTEKHAEPSVKAVGQTPEVIKQGSRGSTTLTPSTNAASSPAGSTTTVKTSTTTLRPQVSSDADFEYEDDAALDEEQVPEVPEIQKSTPVATRTTEAPISKGLTSAEKLSNQNPINQLDRSRGPKILQSAEKFDDAADYKLEAEASQEEEAHVRSKGQPQRQAATSSEEDEQTADAPEVEVSREPSTSAPASTSGLDISQMSTLAKTHKDSVNVPIVIKQSSLLKAVPVSQLQSQSELAPERPSTSPFTTPSTTTTTTTAEAASEVVPSVRPSPPRLRGQRLRGNNANVTPRPTPASTPAPEQSAEEKPQQSIRRPTLRDSPRRIQSRRPVKESPEEIPEQQPAASPIIETHARPLPIRPRFPPRTGNHVTTTAAAPAEVVSEIPAAAVTPSAAELNSLEDKRTKDTHVRAKSANDLYAFTRLQQAISSRAPSRVQPKLVAGFVNSAEVTTDAMTSSEVTTVSSFGGQSSETVVDDAPSTTSTTTTTTTTEAVQLDKFGRQRGRFGAGRTRRPGATTGGDGPRASTTTTTETPNNPTARGRFNGGRRRGSTTATPEETGQQSSSVPAESPKPKLPARNRFASRNRGSTTETPVTTVEEQKTAEVEKPSTPAVAQPARRRPGAFGGRRRPNQLHTSQTETTSVAQEETAASAVTDASPTTASATSTAAPATQEHPGRNRFSFGNGGRARPSAAPGNNPVRIRGGGRLRGPTTTTTTEATPEETQPDAEQPADAEQSPTIQSEHIEPAQNVPAPEAPAPVRGTGGVLGRLKNRPKLVVTTTTTPDAVHLDRKPGRLNGILNRRKNLGQLTAAAHVKEEVRETTSEVAEESDNHAQEVEDDHKGVVVQISSSVTESEEVNEAAGEVVEPSSTTTPGSILNRLKSQRKPGSLFRKKPDPHGE